MSKSLSRIGFYLVVFAAVVDLGNVDLLGRIGCRKSATNKRAEDARLGRCTCCLSYLLLIRLRVVFGVSGLPIRGQDQLRRRSSCVQAKESVESLVHPQSHGGGKGRRSLWWKAKMFKCGGLAQVSGAKTCFRRTAGLVMLQTECPYAGGVSPACPPISVFRF